MGYFKQVMDHPSLDKEILTAITNQLKQLNKEGHLVEEIAFPLLDIIVPAYYVLTTAEASSNLSRYDGIRFGHQTKTPVKDLTDFYLKNRSEGFGKEVKKNHAGYIRIGTGYYDAYYQKAQQVRKLLSDQISLVFKSFDAVILPTCPSTAFTF